MKRVSTLVLLFPALLILSTLQAQESPYVHAQQREIKALSPEEVAGYLAGEGMGFALAAELSSYPGPKHTLELAEPIGLTPRQRTETQRVFEVMRQAAIRLGGEIVARERQLDSLFAHGSITQDQLRGLVNDLARLRGELRYAHLRAHLEMKQILTPEQVRRYVGLRGYHKGEHH
ncbi:MAG: hypothetical protein GTN62_08235 [Gemmatimonadales bacterium]|nr:hypothetical protein [Gemmatimonadales bacterium]NIN11479.1 hypothetical protein [Gemmatimonadales bacterium]NIN50088.1 hypothetical protein [Gemmatimonadales bacterium]NIP07552.1 hypothetical protein [Gemmatimonadales bacterium]NIR03194.1 hypothetical protein [Gemmatimonadales bacterium]